MGLLQNSTRGLGTVSVNGLRRVPKPPTKIRAFKAPDCAVLLVMVLIAGLRSEEEQDVLAMTAIAQEEPRPPWLQRWMPHLIAGRSTRVLVTFNRNERLPFTNPTTLVTTIANDS